MTDRARALLALSLLKGVGPKTLRQALAGAPEGITDETRWPSLAPAVARALDRPGEGERVRREAARQEDALRADGARLHALGDPGFPARLAETPDPPVLLFVNGNLEPVRERVVAVVGTREPTRHGIRAAALITAHLAGRAFSVVSGLAAGIDGAAHEAALAGGGHTVAVLAHGLDALYPAAHRGLAERIVARGGALVSEYPYGTRPYGPLFVQRDRIQAGLAQGTVLVQSAKEGGSLHASRAALRYGRLLVVPVPSDEDRERGEPKAQGVQFLVEADDEARAALLQTRPEVIRKLLFVLRSRRDYPELETRLS